MSIISTAGQENIKRKLEEPAREYWETLNRLAQADQIIYPTLPTAIEKAQAELKNRRSIPRNIRTTLEKTAKLTAEKLKAWQEQLEKIEVAGERKLLETLRYQAQTCKQWLVDMDAVPARLERLIEAMKNPVIGNFTVESVARMHWTELNSLLSRPGAYEAIPAGIEERRKEIERAEEIVRRRIDAGEFRRRPGAAKANKPPRADVIDCRSEFDPRD